MIGYEAQLTQFVLPLLPQGAELMAVEGPVRRAAVHAVDLDGDGMREIAVVYRLNGEPYLTIFKWNGARYVPAARVHGTGYAVTELASAPVTQHGRDSLLVGWQVGSIWSKLSVYNWAREGMVDVASPEVDFSYMEIVDYPGRTGADGTVEIADWVHDTGEAYMVDVLKWQDGRFVSATEAYPYYFPRVAAYYDQLTSKYPDYPFYWYYLADAQLKAGFRQEAAATIEHALGFDNPYPSREKLLDMQKQLMTRNELRAVTLFPASVKEVGGVRWGYIDSRGEFVIKPRYDYAFDFQNNGLAVVQERDKTGIIDSNGTYIVKPIYDSISPFTEGRAIVIDHDGFKVMDESGRILTGKAYSYISNYSDGRAMFSVQSPTGDRSLYGYLDLSGREAIPARYLEANDFRHGKAVVKVKDGEYALIGHNGQVLHTYSLPYVGTLGDGLMAFQKEVPGKYGYLNERGEVVIEPKFTSALPFQDGRAIVNTAEDYNNRYGLIDKTGKEIIAPKYNMIQWLGEQRVALGTALDPQQPWIGSRYAIAGTDGQMLTDFRYSDVQEYDRGLASATDRTKTFFIDRTGKAASGYPKLNGTGVLKLEDSLIQANLDQRLSYVNKAGRVVWQQNTIIPLSGKYRVKELKYKPNKDYLVYYPQVEGMPDKSAQHKVNEKLQQMSQVKRVPSGVQLDYSYTGDFNVTYYKKNLLVLELSGYNFPFGAAHGMPSKIYAHIDLVTGRMYELKDLFKPGSDYDQVLSAIVGEQIKNDPQYSYVFPDTYKGIAPDQPFFVTSDALHLYFAPYEIAPYAAGFPTFKIPFSRIHSIINEQGPFWRSFH